MSMSRFVWVMMIENRRINILRADAIESLSRTQSLDKHSTGPIFCIGLARNHSLSI